MTIAADFAQMFADSEDEITIDGNPIAGFIVRPGIIEEPFYGPELNAGIGTGLSVIVQQADLEALNQWPLDDPEIEFDGVSHRAIRPHASVGHVQIFVQEAQ